MHETTAFILDFLSCLCAPIHLGHLFSQIHMQLHLDSRPAQPPSGRLSAPKVAVIPRIGALVRRKKASGFPQLHASFAPLHFRCWSSLSVVPDALSVCVCVPGQCCRRRIWPCGSGIFCVWARGLGTDVHSWRPKQRQFRSH